MTENKKNLGNTKTDCMRNPIWNKFDKFMKLLFRNKAILFQDFLEKTSTYFDSFLKSPIELPNKIARPWLKREPSATPTKIKKGFVLLEKESTNNCVLSPNSEIKTNKKAIKKG